MINEITINNITDLIHQLNKLPNNYIFRGHADALWKLESTLERTVGAKWDPDNAIKMEELSCRRFQSKYHIYNKTEYTDQSKLSLLALMQHYGVPTRLLDFSESPYIALYFALEAYNPSLMLDFSIYSINYTKAMEHSIKLITQIDSSFTYQHSEVALHSDIIFEEIDKLGYNILWITEPSQLNERIDRQSGTFVLSINKEKTIESIITENGYEDYFIKFIIKKELYTQVYALLRKMNINSKLLYGDLSGLAKAIKMELQVYSN